MPTDIDIDTIARFLFAYTAQYRAAYKKATAAPPQGPGYPALAISPFLTESRFDVFVALDGVAINHLGKEPDYQWYIAGGPALKVDYEPTVTPPEVSRVLRESDLLGKPIGIYRIVSKNTMPRSVWGGRVQNISRSVERRDESTGLVLNIHEIRGTLKDVVAALTFGAFGNILDTRLPSHGSQVGETHVTKNMGVFPADLSSRRFFTHLEIHGQADVCAWDSRTVTIRAQHDLRRDLARALSNPETLGGGTISLGPGTPWIECYSNRLDRLRKAIDALRHALQSRTAEVEAVFHEVIAGHPLLLDVYGTCESKPQFVYPAGTTSPIGKTSLEPDFIVKYPDQSYKLVELERPSKGVATVQGQPRAEVAQAVFQCAEWKHFIKTHYQQVQSRYPGIQSRCKTAVVMSRTTQSGFRNIEDVGAYKGLMMEQFNIDEFYTYDDLYDRAQTAHALLAGLAPNAV